MPINIPRTSLDELDKVERHLNHELQLSDWLRVRVYEPERQKNNEILWHLGKNPSDKLKNITTIWIYDGHAFLIKYTNKLAKTYVCTLAKHASHKPVIFRDTQQHVHKEEQLSIAQTSMSKFRRELMRELSMAKPIEQKLTSCSLVEQILLDFSVCQSISQSINQV